MASADQRYLCIFFLGGEILSPEEAEGADKDNGKSTPPSLHKYYRWQFAKQT
jgi:hypothetical protein